jgi:hypothetical protein
MNGQYYLEDSVMGLTGCDSVDARAPSKAYSLFERSRRRTALCDAVAIDVRCTHSSAWEDPSPFEGACARLLSLRNRGKRRADPYGNRATKAAYTEASAYCDRAFQYGGCKGMLLAVVRLTDSDGETTLNLSISQNED